jgi:hypothetical protein
MIRTFALFKCEEFGRNRVVGQNERDDNSSNDCGDAVDQEDPSPSIPAVSAVNETDRTCNKLTESSGSRCS